VEPLSASIPSVVRGLLRNGQMSPGKIQAAWRLSVGTAIDRATSVALREDGTLEVAATELAWRREVRRSQGLILSRIRDLVGPDPVRKIKVVTRLSETAGPPAGRTEDSARPRNR
jgi:predicted nucleic acid-binding Zn ribbon protein